MGKLNMTDLNLGVHMSLQCPDCGEHMFSFGLFTEAWWCDQCKQGYNLELRKNKFKEKDLKDVVGWKKLLEARKQEKDIS